MAGLFFWHKTENYDYQVVNEEFKKLGYKTGKYFEISEWNLIIFPKTEYNIQNWLKTDDGLICGTGTFAYKHKFYNNALPLIASDIRNNNLDVTKFWGSFLIFANVTGKTMIIRDGAGLARLHKLKDKPVFSSSFVSLLRTSQTKLNINKSAILELLSTGLIAGKDTIIEEIELVDLDYNCKKLEIIKSDIVRQSIPKSKEQAVEQQINIAKKFFNIITEDWFNYLKDSFLHLDISGGFDTRLVTSLFLNFTKKIQLNTYWRPEDSVDSDYRIANLIAKKLDLPIFTKKIQYSNESSDENMKKIFNMGHNASDGVIRPGTFWDEEFVTTDYRRSLSKRPCLRVTGFGGEQYRNKERISHRFSKSLKSWIRWEMINRFAGNNIITKKDYIHLKKKLIKEIKKSIKSNKFNLYTFKEYRRKVIVVSYRSLHTTMENRYGFMISPLADTNLSIQAMNATKYLGNSSEFGNEMIKRIHSKLSKLPSSYGYSFFDGESKKLKLAANLWEIIPSNIKHKIFSTYRKKKHKSNYIESMINKSIFIRSLVDRVTAINLPLDLKNLMQRNIRGKLIFNLGYFLKVNKEWINE